MALVPDSPEPDAEQPYLRGLGEKCDHGCGREAVFRVLNHRGYENAVTCEECLHYELVTVETADGRQWPF